MKKILLIILLSILGLSACTNTVDLDKIISMIPNQIEENYKLPDEYEGDKLTYYINGNLIEDNILKYEYAFFEFELELEIYKQDKKYTSKKILNKASEAVSTLYIDAENNGEINSKEDYVNIIVTLDAAHGFSKSNLIGRAKGRGNSTWTTYPKKPYRIKFDERQSLLGMDAAKDYVLLAEFGDKSLLRNHVGHRLGELLGVSYNLKYRYVELYLNNVYNGLYLLTEQVAVDKNRLNIDISESSNGFLLELEDWSRIEPGDEENIEYVVFQDRAFLIKDPDLRDFSRDVQIEKSTYIKNYLKDVFDSIDNGTYKNYIDEDSFINFFIAQEITKNVDINFSSVFLFKDHNGKLKAGPLWDFDISMGNGDYYDYQPEGYWAVNNLILSKLLENQSFKTKYKESFLNFLNTYMDDLIIEIEKIALRILVHANKNFSKWNILNEYWWPNTPEMMEANTYLKQITYLKNWLTQRNEWLQNNINYI